MPYYIYSSESLPNPEMMGKPGYTPDSEYIRWGGVTLPVLPKGKWIKLNEHFSTIRRSDWRDRQGTEVDVHISRFKGIINANFAKRGVIFLDHEPSEAEKEKLEALSNQLNMEHRRKAVEFFENQRDMAKARQGQYDAGPYVDECYELLGMKKPYSLDAIEAQRDPGAAAANKIAAAISDANKDLAAILLEAVTNPNSKGKQQPRA